MGTIDLLLSNDIGLWVLDQVDPMCVHRVVTTDQRIADRSSHLGLPMFLGDVNEIDEGFGRVALSVHYPIVLRAALSKYQAAYNLHPGLLPWGRGWYPVFWALWEDTPAGATLHVMTAKLDKGDIIDQIEVSYTDQDTGGTLLRRVREAEQKLFQTYWPLLVQGVPLPTRPQPPGGSYHSKADFERIRTEKGWGDLPGRQIVRLARCLTTDRHPGLHLSANGFTFELILRS